VEVGSGRKIWNGGGGLGKSEIKRGEKDPNVCNKDKNADKLSRTSGEKKTCAKGWEEG